MSPDRESRPRPVLGELSAEAKAARAPLRPEELVGALNDCVHRDPGRARPARTARHANRESLGRVGLVVLALAAHVALHGCGATALDRGRSAVAVTARAVAAADSVAADVIERRFAAVETPEQLERERERADRVVRAFLGVHAALLAADAALDAWEAGADDEGSWLRAVACALPALLALADALEAYDAPEVADGIRAAVGGLAIFMGEECGA